MASFNLSTNVGNVITVPNGRTWRIQSAYLLLSDNSNSPLRATVDLDFGGVIGHLNLVDADSQVALDVTAAVGLDRAVVQGNPSPTIAMSPLPDLHLPAGTQFRFTSNRSPAAVPNVFLLIED